MIMNEKKTDILHLNQGSYGTEDPDWGLLTRIRRSPQHLPPSPPPPLPPTPQTKYTITINQQHIPISI